MRPLTTRELTRYTWVQLVTLLRAIENEVPDLAEGSDERRNALINLYTIRRVLARQQFRAGMNASV
ncbi:MAG: hypothetical protein WDN03_02145 [Rhizomicrobium sp.]